VIPKHTYGYFSTKGRGYINRGILYIFLIGERKIARDLHSMLEVNMNFDQKSAKDGNLRLQRGNRTYRRDMSTPK